MSTDRQISNLLASLKGLPEDDSDSQLRGTVKLDTLMEVLFERHQINQETPEETVLLHWTRILGPSYAARCAPVKIDAGNILLIRVSNAVLRRELQFTEDRIMTALRSLPKCAFIEGVRFIAG